MSMYTLSVIVPAYNAENSLEDCIISIPEDVEVIVIDDGSSDGTGSCADELLENHPNLRVIHQNNAGVSATRNKGIDAASGEYIGFVDADDTVDSIEMSRCVQMLYNNPEIDMLVYGISFDYNRNKKNYRSLELNPPYEAIKTKKECLRDINILFDNNCLSSLCTRIIKKGIIGDLRLREDMFLYEDLEFSLRVINRCETIRFTQNIVYRYKQDEKHISSRLKRVKDIREITDRIDEALSALNCEKEHILSMICSILETQKRNSLTYAELKCIYPDAANQIFVKRVYGKIRHSLAESVKYHIWLLKRIRKQ